MRRWVDLWNRREHPRSMAAVRILLASVLLWDLLRIWAYDLVVPLAGTHAAGGIGVPESLKNSLWVLDWLGTGPEAAWGLWGSMVVSCTALLLGLLPRLSALVLVLLGAARAAGAAAGPAVGAAAVGSGLEPTQNGRASLCLVRWRFGRVDVRGPGCVAREGSPACVRWKCL